MSKLGEEQAFPLFVPPPSNYVVSGMTYRQYLIGQALAGVCANPASALMDYNPDYEGDDDTLLNVAVEITLLVEEVLKVENLPIDKILAEE